MPIDQLTSTFIDPDVAASAIATMLPYADFHAIGMALIALFAMNEVYRIWMSGDERTLAFLAAKIAIVGYLTNSTTLKDIVMTTLYGYFARLGINILHQGGAQQYQILNSFFQDAFAASSISPNGNLLTNAGAVLATLLNDLIMGGILLLFLIVFVLVLALYIFAVLGSRLFIVLSVALAPLLLPCILWRSAASIIERWVQTTLFACLLPVVGALGLVAALNMGLVSPLQGWDACVKQAIAAGTPPYNCIGSQLGGFMLAILGGFVAVALMTTVSWMTFAYVGTPATALAGWAAGRMGTHVAKTAGSGVVNIGGSGGSGGGGDGGGTGATTAATTSVPQA